MTIETKEQIILKIADFSYGERVRVLPNKIPALLNLLQRK